MVLNRNEVVYTEMNRLPGKSINTRSVDSPLYFSVVQRKKIHGGQNSGTISAGKTNFVFYEIK